MKQTKLTEPHKIKIKQKTFWRVTAPAPGGGRIRRTFKEKEDARVFYERSKVQLAQFGRAAMLDERVRSDAARAAEILQGTGKTIVDAATFLRDHLQKIQGGKPLGTAVADYLKQKAVEGVSDRHRTDLRLRLNRFVSTQPKVATTANTLTPAIDDFLTSGAFSLTDGTISPQTRVGYRTALHAFFEWAKARKYCADNPVRDAVSFKVVSSAPEILTPAQAAELLAACDIRILPGVVLGIFCAMRQAEISRIDWRHIDLSHRIVTVGADIAKTSGRRTIEIPENAVQWLMPLQKKSGKVWPDGEEARNLWNLARIKAGFGPFFSTRAAVKEAQTDPATEKVREDLIPWPDNALRHSAISYRLAHTRDLSRVATEAGNSPEIVKRHYAELVKPAEAIKFFAILPEWPEGIIPLLDVA